METELEIVYKMSLESQKWMIMGGLACTNILLISTFITYMEDYWMIYLVLLAPTTVIYSIFALLIVFKPGDCVASRSRSANYVYIVPCYNETSQEISESINSLVDQRTLQGDQRALMIICDGNANTEKELLKLLSADVSHYQDYVYTPIGDNREPVTRLAKIWTGEYCDIPYIMISKAVNSGKRDSLVLARREIYNPEECAACTPVQTFIQCVFQEAQQVDYIIGIDGDTIFKHDCSYELIRAMEGKPECVGCVGLVQISDQSPRWNPLVMFQQAEYLIGQCLKRQAQSITTGKVNCLSGCNQILRVCPETCGDDILRVFNRDPLPDESIFSNIRAYASEDRNHVCLLLSMYPKCKTVQSLSAVCYTRVPERLEIFSSQRRRWTLGAICNDMLLLTLKNINPWERLVAAVSIFVHCITPFVIVATGVFLSVLFTSPTYLMLYLSITMIIPLMFYIFVIPMTVMLHVRYYYLCLAVYITCGWGLSIWCYCKTLWTMNVITWGKTQHRPNAAATVAAAAEEVHDFWIDDELKSCSAQNIQYIVI